ncbi:hypothetical protein DAI22_05g082001 [Oryza sativa Japonica Group]|nr:hypothetical protein DAI22_05g082001 [Oryza sativa Japonica Group]
MEWLLTGPDFSTISNIYIYIYILEFMFKKEAASIIHGYLSNIKKQNKYY